MNDQITIHGARLHNLKNITVTIPKYKLVVLTGLSGSGKSTLGFDILFKEGQRQYLESLGMAEFGLAKPPRLITDSNSTCRCPSRTIVTRSATCSSMAPRARCFAATFRISSHQPPYAREGSKASPPTYCAATRSIFKTPTIARRWESSWSPKPVPTARAHACDLKAVP